jgi:hypothetical protein
LLSIERTIGNTCCYHLIVNNGVCLSSKNLLESQEFCGLFHSVVLFFNSLTNHDKNNIVVNKLCHFYVVDEAREIVHSKLQGVFNTDLPTGRDWHCVQFIQMNEVYTKILDQIHSPSYGHGFQAKISFME